MVRISIGSKTAGSNSGIISPSIAKGFVKPTLGAVPRHTAMKWNCVDAGISLTDELNFCERRRMAVTILGDAREQEVLIGIVMDSSSIKNELSFIERFKKPKQLTIILIALCSCRSEARGMLWETIYRL
jgi:hypothetical protein